MKRTPVGKLAVVIDDTQETSFADSWKAAQREFTFLKGPSALFDGLSAEPGITQAEVSGLLARCIASLPLINPTMFISVLGSLKQFLLETYPELVDIVDEAAVYAHKLANPDCPCTAADDPLNLPPDAPRH